MNNNRNLVCLFFLSRMAGKEGKVTRLPKKPPFSGHCHRDQFRKQRLILTAGKLVPSYRRATEQLRAWRASPCAHSEKECYIQPSLLSLNTQTQGGKGELEARRFRWCISCVHHHHALAPHRLQTPFTLLSSQQNYSGSSTADRIAHFKWDYTNPLDLL